jgi:hypothetical protein
MAGALVGGVQGAFFGKWQTASQPQQQQRIAHPLQLLVLESKGVSRMPAFIIQTMTHASFSAVLWFATFEQVRQLISSSWMATLDRVPSPESPRPLVTSQLAFTTSTTVVRLIPTLLRSAPKYALFFCGYQKLLQTVQP